MRRVSDPVIKDHRELEEYYNNILNATTDDEKTRWQNQFVWELARHSAGEEIVKELLHKFQGMNATDSAFSPTLRQLWADLSEHIKHEEEEDLVRLEEALSAAKSAEMAKSFQRTKMFVPTHAHPSAPDKPPFETVVGLMTAPIDKLLDVFHRFPKGEQ
ncbi:hypothetical protein BGZ80_007053 [Entomortierella chlamydospora]|uniref:Hemerythrin-like domain-containing protein n=1 Tax=Entomortierella chlamydospora TaxID=101097 RepID=A0A9P6SSI5_9FUNG|nr:hypothetical protein BGZ80_007053 [Entomortierella chlamydospora]